MKRTVFWATRPGTKEREAEEKLAREMDLDLRECKPIEGAAHGILAGNESMDKGSREAK